jgi:hypothetical protein
MFWGRKAVLSVVIWLDAASARRFSRSCASKRASKFSSSMSISCWSSVEEERRCSWVGRRSVSSGSSEADGRSLESRFEAIILE